MLDCKRCGSSTPRLTPTQRHCPQCSREVAELLRKDAERQRVRFERAKDFSGALA